MTVQSRRVLATRDTSWARSLGAWLGRAGVRPNAVSLAGVVFALGGGAAFAAAPDLGREARTAALVGAAVAIQLRLLCNLLDGMLAVEEGFKGKGGDVYNDLPDRLADIVLLVGAGSSLRGVPFGLSLGWLAATLAVLTAYVRLLGGSLGLAQDFSGPMAKPHRMFTLTVVSLLAAIESLLGLPSRVMLAGLAAIVSGAVVTIVGRTRRILIELERR